MVAFKTEVLKVLGLISSPDDPASRVRIMQYGDHLKKHEIFLCSKAYRPLRNSDPARWMYFTKRITGINPWRISNTIKLIARFPLIFSQNNYDIIWQNRLIVPGYSCIESKIRKPGVFDFDDAIWMNEGRKYVEKAIQKSAIVFAGNEYLASHALKHNKNTHLIPSTIDTSILKPLNKKFQHFTLGWIGSPSNFVNLESIKKPIIDFLERFADSKLMIVSSKAPKFFSFDNERIIFKKWNNKEENSDINNFSIGLMPLLNNEWNLGKCSYKMLQYMSCGKPVVVSPVGNNANILKKAVTGIGAVSEEEWLNAFSMMKEDHEYYSACAENARRLVYNEYDTSKWAKKIAETFHSLI